MSGRLRFERVAITGGAGYVGSALVPALIGRGYDVSVLDLFLYGEGVFAGVSNPTRLHLVRGDVGRSLAGSVRPAGPTFLADGLRLAGQLRLTPGSNAREP